MRTLRHTLATTGTLFTALLIFTGHTAAQRVPTLTTLHSFTGGSDGEELWGGVVIGSGGVLYGTSGGGGTSSACYEGCGTVFSLTPPASPGGVWTEAVFYSFTGGDGADPEASVVIGSGGVLYGTTWQGGTGSCNGTGCGTVFSLTPPLSPGGTWTQTVLHNFTGSPGDGASPQAALVIGGDGVLYGTTPYGGSGACVLPGSGTGCGTVFSLTPPAAPGGAWTETVLYSFTGYPTVGTNPYANPYAGVVVGSGGVLYGTTQNGGASGNGTVYSLTPPAAPGGAWAEAVLCAFTGASDGSVPVGGVVIGNGGVLFGTTELGGTGTCTGPGISACGTVFSLTPPTSAGGAWTQTVLYSFTGSDGEIPTASIVIGTGGVLYGTTFVGGSSDGLIINDPGGSGLGAVFSLTPPTSPGGAWTETVLYSFTGSDGASPNAGVVIGKKGALYGTTLSTVFSLSLQQGTGLPSINTGGLVNAASYAVPVAPGSIASAFGNFLLSSPVSSTQSPLPADISGFSLRFSNGTAAPLFFVSGGQTNLQVPWELTEQATIGPVNLTAALNGQPGFTQTVLLAPYAPAIFTTNAKGSGQGAILDPSYRLVNSSNPATAGSFILIYCTGLGEVTTDPPTGSPAPLNQFLQTLTTPTVTIGGLPAKVSFSGLAPGYVGLYQVNALVPAGLAASNFVPVVLSIGGIALNTVTSNTVTIAVQ